MQMFEELQTQGLEGGSAARTLKALAEEFGSVSTWL